jgi:hypothetical protein
MRLEILPLFVDREGMQPISNRGAELEVGKPEKINSHQIRIVSGNAI